MLSTVLLPFSWLAGGLIALKERRYRQHPEKTQRSNRPVMVVGNIIVGGTGKTPVVIALVQALQARGWTPGVISRGYGVSLGEQARTGQGSLPAHEYGDEPALIAAATGAPIAVHPRRTLALQALERDYPATDLIIADDGLQHLALGRDLEVLVQDARGIGNGRLLPAGPLREPATRIQSVDFVITNVQAGCDDPAPTMMQPHHISMRLVPVQVQHLTTGVITEWQPWMAAHGDEPVSAVAAIGQPERFFAMLRHSGLVLADAIAMPDHDAFEQSPFEPLANAPILITAKDAVKCARFNDPRLWVVHVAPEFSDITWIERVHEMLVAIAARKASMASDLDKH